MDSAVILRRLSAVEALERVSTVLLAQLDASAESSDTTQYQVGYCVGLAHAITELRKEAERYA